MLLKLERSLAVSLFFVGLLLLLILTGAFFYKATTLLLLYLTAASLILPPRFTWRDMNLSPNSPGIWGTGLFLLYGLSTCYFSLAPLWSLRAEAGFIGLLLCWLVIYQAPFLKVPAEDCQKLQKFFIVFFTLTLMLLGAEVLTQGKIARLLTEISGSIAPARITLKPAAALMVLAFVPMVAFTTALKYPLIPWVWGGCLLWCCHKIHAQAAFIAVIGGGAVFYLAYLRPLWAVYAGSVGSFLVIVFTPWIKFFFFPTFLSELYLANTHTLYHRFLIWDFVIERIFEKPFFGWGWGASRFLPNASQKAFQNMAFIPVHPHNNSLQLWVELGGVGTLLVASLVSWLFWQLRGYGAQRLYVATYTALLGVLLILNSSSYSLWHTWWLSWIGLMCLLPRFLGPATPKNS